MLCILVISLVCVWFYVLLFWLAHFRVPGFAVELVCIFAIVSVLNVCLLIFCFWFSCDCLFIGCLMICSLWWRCTVSDLRGVRFV